VELTHHAAQAITAHTNVHANMAEALAPSAEGAASEFPPGASAGAALPAAGPGAASGPSAGMFASGKPDMGPMAGVSVPGETPGGQIVACNAARYTVNRGSK
jgi:hypothetical protein